MFLKKLYASLILFFVGTFLHGKTPIELKELNTFFDKYKVVGSILIYDLNKNEYLGYNLERCNNGYSPASTFKIPNTLIALETRTITTDTIFKWNGEKLAFPTWETDMNIYRAYRVSNVPVYQSIARGIGAENMQHYIRLLNYGDMDINAENIDTFWLVGESKITQYQQIYFLHKLYNSEFPLKQETMDTVKDIMLWTDTENYKVRAKTGWAIQNQTNIGWFVGYVETKENVFFFATNIEPTSLTDMDNFTTIRENITINILSHLKIID